MFLNIYVVHDGIAKQLNGHQQFVTYGLTFAGYRKDGNTSYDAVIELVTYPPSPWRATILGGGCIGGNAWANRLARGWFWFWLLGDKYRWK